MTDNHYPDSDPDTLGELKSIRRLPRMEAIAPNISWGKDYKSWSLRRRLRFAERLASTMNHAADILQQERSGLIDVAKKQEAQIKQLQASLASQDSVMHQELASQNAAQQELNKLIVELQGTIKTLKKELERGNDD